MTEKILILDREKNTLETQDADDELSYSYIHSITHIKKDKTEYGAERQIFDIFNGGTLVGYITNIKEIKEVWQK